MAKIKLYALTGFLGSGKTTVLKKLLTEMQGKKIGVIQNEFGKISIDGEILRTQSRDIKMVEISKGSIFCSCLKGSFAQALIDMSKEDLEYVFVESSGLADPSNMAEILQGVAITVGPVYDFSGAICLVDAIHFEAQAEDIETVTRQLEHCNLAIISKVDLIDADKLETVVAKIKKINPICKVIYSDNGNFDSSFMDQDLTAYQWKQAEDSLNTVDNKPKTLFLNCYKNISKDLFNQFLDELKSDTYRLKGFFLLDNQWQQVDVVEERVDYEPCSEKEHSQLVIISKIGPAIIKKIFAAWEEIFGEKPELKN
jgi:G3E family GTPase